jgi:beta-lactamase class A
MDRRAFLGATGAAAVTGLAAPAVLAANPGALGSSRIEAALARFRRLPGRTAYMIRVSPPGKPWETSHHPNAALFVGSSIKTFILVKFLQDVEAGRRSEDTQETVDDGVRSLASPVLLNLTGTTTARSVLEAMIAHSDNTATDVALKRVGPDRVRAFVSRAGFTSVKIPTSTRLLFSYLAGAPFGVDIGWEGMLDILADKFPGRPRSPANDRETMKGSASDFVTYYERALKGRYFEKAESLTEFRRISAMANALPPVVPQDVAAFGKGGSIEWEGFNCLSVAGQMVPGATVPVTFYFTVNWEGPPSTIPTVSADYVGAIHDALHETARTFEPVG